MRDEEIVVLSCMCAILIFLSFFLSFFSLDLENG